jgi:hypothetical protein
MFVIMAKSVDASLQATLKRAMFHDTVTHRYDALSHILQRFCAYQESVPSTSCPPVTECSVQHSSSRTAIVLEPQWHTLVRCNINVGKLATCLVETELLYSTCRVVSDVRANDTIAGYFAPHTTNN